MVIILKYFKIALLAMAAGLVCFSCQPRAVGTAGSEEKTLTWAEMNFEQRKAHMRQAVLAPAAELFKSWRQEKYPDRRLQLVPRAGCRS